MAVEGDRQSGRNDGTDCLSVAPGLKLNRIRVMKGSCTMLLSCIQFQALMDNESANERWAAQRKSRWTDTVTS